MGVISIANYPHYFIGIPISQSNQQWLNTSQKQIQEENELVFKTWTDPTDLHITLKFLGPVNDDQLKELSSKLEIMHTIPSFALKVGTIGTFGNERQPRVLWADVEESKQLNQLYNTITDVCSEIGFREEKRAYRPHITLAKKWNGKRLVNSIAQDFSIFLTGTRKADVNYFVIYQIHPSKTPKYEIIKKIDLK